MTEKQPIQLAPPAPLRRFFTVIDGASGQQKPYIAEGSELQTQPKPTQGVLALMKPENWPGSPENWW